MLGNFKNELIEWIGKVEGKYQQRWTFVDKTEKFYSRKWILYLTVQKY